MSSPQGDRPPESIEAVRKAYREAGFDEQPPAHVDERVLAAAKRASKPNVHGYLPSLAVAATILLALGLVLRLTLPGPSLQERAAEEEPVTAPTGPAAPAQRRRIQERAAPLEAAGPAAADESTPPQDTAAPTAATIANEAAGEGPASSAAARMALPDGVDAPCSQSQREEAGAWLACIGALIEGDALDAAREELDAFRLAYPDYSVPASMAEALEP